MVWSWSDGPAVWHPSSTDMVGILLGYHGAGYILCYLWHNHSYVCILCLHKTGTLQLWAYVIKSESTNLEIETLNQNYSVTRWQHNAVAAGDLMVSP